MPPHYEARGQPHVWDDVRKAGKESHDDGKIEADQQKTGGIEDREDQADEELAPHESRQDGVDLLDPGHCRRPDPFGQKTQKAAPDLIEILQEVDSDDGHDEEPDEAQDEAQDSRKHGGHSGSQRPGQVSGYRARAARYLRSPLLRRVRKTDGECLLDPRNDACLHRLEVDGTARNGGPDLALDDRNEEQRRRGDRDAGQEDEKDHRHDPGNPPALESVDDRVENVGQDESQNERREDRPEEIDEPSKEKDPQDDIKHRGRGVPVPRGLSTPRPLRHGGPARKADAADDVVDPRNDGEGRRHGQDGNVKRMSKPRAHENKLAHDEEEL